MKVFILGVAIFSSATFAQDARMTSPAANVLGFNTNSVERLRIDSTGNVGIGTTNPQAALDVNGNAKYRSGISAPVRVVTAAGAITVTTSDYIICVNKTSGAATTVNLPSSPATGDIYIVKDCKGDASTNNITLTPSSGNIDGAASFVINVSRQSVGTFWDGTQWQVF